MVAAHAEEQMQVRILWTGRTRSRPLELLCSEYLSRLQHTIPCSVDEVPDLSKRRNLRGKERQHAESEAIAKRLSEGARVVVLDERGAELTSQEFAAWFQKELNRGTRELAFVLGGPEGLSPSLKRRALLKLSLGRMTWPHEIARVLLLEQVYRAFSILRNSPYHR